MYHNVNVGVSFMTPAGNLQCRKNVRHISTDSYIAERQQGVMNETPTFRSDIHNSIRKT
ncbi:MAG: hypothetical protein PVS3B3_09930 [Ktedonobacteraceae bacterium]